MKSIDSVLVTRVVMIEREWRHASAAAVERPSGIISHREGSHALVTPIGAKKTVTVVRVNYD